MSFFLPHLFAFFFSRKCFAHKLERVPNLWFIIDRIGTSFLDTILFEEKKIHKSNQMEFHMWKETKLQKIFNPKSNLRLQQTFSDRGICIVARFSFVCLSIPFIFSTQIMHLICMLNVDINLLQVEKGETLLLYHADAND